MRPMSIETPPSIAATWPSSEVPTPNGITGEPCLRARRMMAATSSVFSGNTTTSGLCVA